MAEKPFYAKHGLNVYTAGSLLLSTNSTALSSNITIKVGSNVSIDTGTIFVGNSTVNVSISASGILKNGGSLVTSAAGSNTSVQFNDSGSFGNAAGFTFNKSTNVLAAPGGLTVGASIGMTNNQSIYLNSSNTRYITFDGTDYLLPGAGLKINGQTAWHAGNDGAGTGLDADTVDGYDSSAFVRKADTTQQAVAGDFLANTLITYRTGATSTGYVVLGIDGTKYLGFNGSTYVLPSAQLSINGQTAWHAGNDGAGSGLDADTVDGVQASAFAQLAGSPSFSTKITVTGGGLQGNQPIANASSSMGALEVQSNGTGAAALAFHRTGSWAGYFGLDTDNVWKVGGWSYGAVAHTLWHSGNDGSGTGLDADLLDGYQASAFALLSSSPTFTGTVTGSAFNTSSDRELKTQIKEIDREDLISLGEVDFKSYVLKNDPEKTKQYGVIAQSIEHLYPHLVKTGKDGFKSVNYTGLLALFAAQVQKHERTIANLSYRLSQLEGIDQ